MTSHPKGQSLQLLLTTLLSTTVIITAAALGYFYYQAITQQTLQAQMQLFSATQRQVVANLARAEERAGAVSALLAHSALTAAQTPEQQQAFVPQLIASLKDNPSLQAVYAGFADGRFFLVRRMDAPSRAIFPSAPAQTHWLLQQVRQTQPGQSVQNWTFLDAAGQPVGTPRQLPTFYDPRQRPWYALAQHHDGNVHTEPYRFSTTGLLGMTVASRSPDRQAVIGVDMRLQDLSQTLRDNLPSPHSLLLLINQKREVLVSTDSSEQARRAAPLNTASQPVLRDLAQSWQLGSVPPDTLLSDDEPWVVSISSIAEISESPHYLLMLMPRDELFAEGQNIAEHALRIPLLFLLLMLPAGWLISRAMSQPIRALVEATSRIQALDFSHDDPPPTGVREMNELLDVSRNMKSTIQDFITLSRQMVAEHQQEQLMSMVLRTTARALPADQAGMWLLQQDQTLHPLLPEDAQAREAALGPLSLDDPLVRAAQESGGEPVQLCSTPSLVPKALRPLLKRHHHRITILPMRLESKALFGLLILIEDDSPDRPVHNHRLHYLKALTSFAAIAIENRLLANSLKALMNALVELMASAIDTKSPYTGRHCQRVPQVARMLADAACQTQSGPLAKFSMATEDQEALFIASWLHDCGKVTTPEYVVDKATKLETLYDRIHEIRMRFEVLKRDADIRYWQGLFAGGDARQLAAECEQEKAQLDEEFAFVAQCNQGSEFMRDEELARLTQIGQRTWLRTLDDRLGLGFLEQRRLSTYPTPPLPVQETLLSDKPEHCIPRPAGELLPPDNRWGFNMAVPVLRMHRGERYNLSVRRGTLNEEERYIINEHIVTTIKMLESLPLPKHLSRVPEIAGGHHERMDGKGYPRGIKGDQMSVLARIMAIADVFEALTASDRPYKPAKRMSEVLRIMSRMTSEGHLDPVLLRLFLESGIWRDYAAQYLSAELCDVEEVDAYLAMLDQAA
ncbi:HD domain-containing phosphohydrolase [Paludibacterium sp.]|uniref:HD domain-containing phosphohydrolase n=1 Tax=Paludibacterium sp. TaxID=1917523 RepID=UPI0025E09C27|nr:HD domain-containing phosphohydrolase [Paludibacterium sp.]